MTHTDTLRSTLAGLLAQHGFSITDGPSLATKEYETAVGPKQAIVWLSPSPDEVGTRTLSGQYFSEGRNVLASSSQLILTGDDADVVAHKARTFVSDAERQISESYAARLLRL